MSAANRGERSVYENQEFFVRITVSGNAVDSCCGVGISGQRFGKQRKRDHVARIQRDPDRSVEEIHRSIHLLV